MQSALIGYIQRKFYLFKQILCQYELEQLSRKVWTWMWLENEEISKGFPTFKFRGL